MQPDLFASLDPLLRSGDPAAGLDFLIARFREAHEYSLLFEARLMKKRHEMGLPLIQSADVAVPEYQDFVVGAAREAGNGFLADGKIARAWPYFRAISEPDPVAAAIDRVDAASAEHVDQIISIAFQEGVHPRKGLELILSQSGMCRAITAFGMQAVAKDRQKCIALLAEAIHREIVERMRQAITEQEGAAPQSESLLELMEGRDWLFGEWGYYVDSSHLYSVVPYGIEVIDREALRIFAELCAYGRKLAPQFQQTGIPPFEDQFTAYGHYIEALRGNDVDTHVEYFRQQVAAANPDVAGDAPARTLVKLLTALGRPREALEALLEGVFEDAPYGTPVPSALQLCIDAGEFDRMQELARERGDLLSYAAGSILAQRR